MTRISAARATAVSLLTLSLAVTLAAQSPDAPSTAGTTQSAVATSPTSDQADQPSVSSLQTSEAPAPSPSASKVRIVRLSEIKGAVLMDRANGGGMEQAVANLPVVENSRIQTATGAAEIEFEDNSTLRVGPNSIVEFPKLERLPGGTTVSSVRLVKGMAYVSLLKTPGNEFNLLFGEQNLRLPAASHIRLQLDDKQARLAVLDGGVHIETGSGVLDVPKKRTVTFSLTDASQPEVAKEVSSDPFDEWDRTAVSYHSRVAAMSAFGNSPYSYGMNDMAYYGNFFNAGGCGMMWRPYFASAAWDPYANGAWAWYSGAGYSWVSPYPWGWMPYHYGAWSYCDGTGWGWMPGGDWMGLNNYNNNYVALNTFGGLRNPIHRPVAPVHPPMHGQPGIVGVSNKPIIHSGMTANGEFLFRKDSAGMGVPREGLGKLDRYSRNTMERGVASTPAYIQEPSSAGGRSHPTSGAIGVSSIHRGSVASGGGGFSGGNPNSGSRASGPSTSSISSGSHGGGGSSGGGGGSHH